MIAGRGRCCTFWTPDGGRAWGCHMIAALARRHALSVTGGRLGEEGDDDDQGNEYDDGDDEDDGG